MEHPADRAGKAAAHALRIWREGGGPVPLPTPEQRLERAGRLLALGIPKQLVKSLDKLDAAKPPPAAAARSRLMRAQALLMLGRRADGEAMARPLLADKGVPEDVRLGARSVLARSLARDGKTEEAAALYRTLAAGKAQHFAGMQGSPKNFRDETAYLAAWLWFDAGQWARAADELGKFAKEHPKAKRLEDARWFRAFALWRAGQTKDAQEAMAALSKGPLKAQALYWRGRLARPAEAAAFYKAAYVEAGGGWYSLLSSSRLAALGEKPPPLPQLVSSGPIEAPAELKASRGLERATALLALGLEPDASLELGALVVRHMPSAAAAALAEVASQAGEADISYRLAVNHLAPTPRAMRWGYPQAFSELLWPVAKSVGVDPYFVLAVMRRESAFKPRARSAAAAYGLLQMIEPTAERLATVAGVSRTISQYLPEPAVNIELGAYYLSLLQGRFGEPALVLAAYNAGPKAVTAWTEARAGLPLDEFVETIPYRDTRHYVKNVITDWAVYRHIYGAGELVLDPERKIPKSPPGVAF
jgi:soluble lytic murein transglycosylase